MKSNVSKKISEKFFLSRSCEAIGWGIFIGMALVFLTGCSSAGVFL